MCYCLYERNKTQSLHRLHFLIEFPSYHNFKIYRNSSVALIYFHIFTMDILDTRLCLLHIIYKTYSLFVLANTSSSSFWSPRRLRMVSLFFWATRSCWSRNKSKARDLLAAIFSLVISFLPNTSLSGSLGGTWSGLNLSCKIKIVDIYPVSPQKHNINLDYVASEWITLSLTQ